MMNRVSDYFAAETSDRNAALGWLIKSMERVGLQYDRIDFLVRCMRAEMDLMTADEASTHYTRSPY